MNREVILTCTDRGAHDDDPGTLLTWTFPGGVESGEYVRWTPVWDSVRLTLECEKCGRTWWIGDTRRAYFVRLVSGLERHSRTVGRVEFDFSMCRDLD